MSIRRAKFYQIALAGIFEQKFCIGRRCEIKGYKN